MFQIQVKKTLIKNQVKKTSKKLTRLARHNFTMALKSRVKIPTATDLSGLLTMDNYLHVILSVR
jgi:hypothetical protein